MSIPNPNIAAINAAIRRIQSGSQLFSCFALEAALEASHRGHSPKEGADYWWQYRQCCADRSGTLPHWWGSSQPFKQERIAALKKFRQVCIDNAKRQAPSPT